MDKQEIKVFADYITINGNKVSFGTTLWYIRYADMAVGKVKLSDKFISTNDIHDHELFLSEESRDVAYYNLMVDEDKLFKETPFTGEQVLNALKNNPLADKSIDYTIYMNATISELKKQVV